MTEHLPSLGGEQKFSRRKFIGAAIGAAATAKVGRELTEGVKFNKYPLFLQTEGIEDIEPLSGHIFGSDGGTLSRSGDKLIFDPRGDFFVPNKEFDYVHRTNSVEAIQEAHAMGANLFDIDVNNVHGSLYGEHGVIPQTELNLGGLAIKLHLPAVFDVNEKEVKLGMPEHSYEELVSSIGSLSTDDRPLAVSAELKRGAFEVDVLYEILDIHKRCSVPVLMHSPDSEHLMDVGGELAGLYNVPG